MYISPVAAVTWPDLFDDSRRIRFRAVLVCYDDRTCVEGLIGVQEPRAGKRGPAPKLQQQLEQIQALPKAKQRAIAQVLDSVLAAHQ